MYFDTFSRQELIAHALQVDMGGEERQLMLSGITDCDTKDGEKFDEMIRSEAEYLHERYLQCNTKTHLKYY